MSWIKEDYKEPVNYGNYTKLEEGENTLRILSEPIMGYEIWKDDLSDEGKTIRKPLRFKEGKPIPMEEVGHLITEQNRLTFFWAMVVYNQTAKKMQIWEVKQATIRRQILALAQSKKWGDVRDYNLSITKTKTGSESRDVEYTVMPEPKEKLDTGIAKLYKDAHINLEALFDGADPFKEDAVNPDDVPDNL